MAYPTERSNNIYVEDIETIWSDFLLSDSLLDYKSLRCSLQVINGAAARNSLAGFMRHKMLQPNV